MLPPTSYCLPNSASMWKEYQQTITLSAEQLMGLPDAMIDYLKKSAQQCNQSQNAQESCLKQSVEVKVHHNGFSRRKGIRKFFIERGLV